MTRMTTLLLLALLGTSLSGCVVYPGGPGPHAYWVPGHYGPYGGWHSGHWQ